MLNLYAIIMLYRTCQFTFKSTSIERWRVILMGHHQCVWSFVPFLLHAFVTHFDTFDMLWYLVYTGIAVPCTDQETDR